jgi:hypothetical protein
MTVKTRIAAAQQSNVFFDLGQVSDFDRSIDVTEATID